MRRKRRVPGTQLARAGERTVILTVDKPVDEVRFRAAALTGPPAGRIEIETGADLPQTEELKPENRIPGEGLVGLSVVPDSDTAITFLPVARPGNTPALIGGLVLVAGAVGWTLFDLMLG